MRIFSTYLVGILEETAFIPPMAKDLLMEKEKVIIASELNQGTGMHRVFLW